MISIIIPTLNRSGSLVLTLQSLVTQNFLPNQFEVLILDNGSTDDTKLVSEDFINHFTSHSIRYVFEPEPGLLSGRHRGALEAKGEILVFIDDDIEADINWLKAIQDSFADSTIHLVGGRNLPKYEVEPPEWLNWFWDNHEYGRYCCYLSLLDFGDKVREIDPLFIWGLNYSIRRETLFALDGFHPDCISRDLQYFQGDGESGLSMKLAKAGYKAVYQPKAQILHQVPSIRMTYEYFDKRFFYQGVCDSYSQFRFDDRKNSDGGLWDQLRSFKTFLRKLKQRMERSLRSKNTKNQLNIRFLKQYQEGYQFHRKAVYNNPELLSWVLKEDYWNYKLPNIRIVENS